MLLSPLSRRLPNVSAVSSAFSIVARLRGAYTHHLLAYDLNFNVSLRLLISYQAQNLQQDDDNSNPTVETDVVVNTKLASGTGDMGQMGCSYQQYMTGSGLNLDERKTSFKVTLEQKMMSLESKTKSQQLLSTSMKEANKQEWLPYNKKRFQDTSTQRTENNRQYNSPTVSEVAAIIINDFGDAHPTRDIVVERKDTGPQRVSELHPSYMALQYPLLFPYREDGFHEKIPYHSNAGTRKTKRGYITMKEYYSYIIQQRPNQGNTLLKGGRLFQQYLVDAYTAVEEQRLKWTRNNQDTLTGAYDNLDLFITFTSNPKWPEISEMVGLFPSSYLLWLVMNIPNARTPAEVDDIHFQPKYPFQSDPEGLKVVNCLYAAMDIAGKDARNAACTSDGKCSKHFPKPFLAETFLDEDGYPHYRRRDNKVTFKKGNFIYDNKHVLPHNRYLLLKYRAHINVEWCNRSKAIKYLFKYLNKGPDRATIVIEENVKNGTTVGTENVLEVDEIKNYLNCRFLAPCEAVWRLFSFDIHYTYPSVMQLTFHLPNQNAITMRDSERLPALLQREGIDVTMFTDWIVYSSPASGERYYLRMLLNVVRGVCGFEELMTVNRRVCATFKEACYEYGLLHDNKECRPQKLWEESWQTLSEDILAKKRKLFNYPNLQLTDEQIRNYCLIEIKELLHKYGRSLSDFKDLPQPDPRLLTNMDNRLIREALDFDIKKSRAEHQHLHSLLNPEQRIIYDDVVQSVHNKKGNFYFVYGPGGTGKTFLYKTIISRLRSDRMIVLAVASSGIASLLLPAGRTAHSRFVIPLELMENSTCGIKQNTQLAELMQEVQLIIWDEAPMTQRYAFEALDKTLRDILGFTDSEKRRTIFGGMTVLLGGDFRQILPVIPQAKRPEIVQACINRSELWRYCKVFSLTRSMRVNEYSNNGEVDTAKQEFNRWVLAVGDGTLPAKMKEGEDEPT
ncbi:ATP-dependent DNA helicase PIF1, partial [Tanacetum coccineum]